MPIRIYSEKVTATIRRIKHSSGVELLRTNTKIHFNDEDAVLGTVFMTNPGSYKMSKHADWNSFIKGEKDIEFITGEDSPDATMRSLIGVVRTAYELVGISKPRGYLPIYNISSLIEPDGSRIKNYHNEVVNLLNTNDINPSILCEQEVSEKDHFYNQCKNSSFIIMGFLKNSFKEDVQRLKGWGEEHKQKLVFAADKEGDYTHPFCWLPKPPLKLQAINRLVDVLRIADR
ncbi:hypothetical protein ACYEXS_34625 [Paenibacillus sp. MAH-36]|uniref:Uracil-DNA glycosylase-like domain-containing protein n=1 Tax=Paenibacillus violae TaxID=3077234 RepID=A0ABU3RNG7_9BACL|nr:hypothetical protein [Paenibacillus sp. PFR10]MDU0205835.1 hypothetical protein [Paenibacillus sp. PFR10]